LTKNRNFSNSRWRMDAILKIVFLAISRCHIGRWTQNLEQRCRITCRYRSRDEICNFRKFKMADGRHFENSIISISQPRIIWLRSNLVGRCRLQFPWWPFKKKSKFCKFKMAPGLHIENVFWQYLGAILADLCKFRNGDEDLHADISRLTKMAIFANSRWRMAAILKIALSPYLSQELSDFDLIWCAYSNFHSEDCYFTKIEIFLIQDGGLTPYWKSFFWLYLGAILADQREIWNRDAGSHADVFPVTWNSEWRWRITCR